MLLLNIYLFMALVFFTWMWFHSWDFKASLLSSVCWPITLPALILCMVLANFIFSRKGTYNEKQD